MLAAASTAAILLAGASARQEGRLVDLTLDAEGLVVWTAFGLPLLVNVSLLARMCVRELRTGGIDLAETLVCGLSRRRISTPSCGNCSIWPAARASAGERAPVAVGVG
ncbi:hypothetical protein [Nocardia abscessus]|uniref:hypothetical protein n=1 Tax=Nocardia abscessus TaxID=120957 RepID=UPI002455F421|nr:hypothetical protein [Nocardia abscessus]